MSAKSAAKRFVRDTLIAIPAVFTAAMITASAFEIWFFISGKLEEWEFDRFFKQKKDTP